MFRTTANCRVCGVEFARPSRRGRPPEYCPEHAPGHRRFAGSWVDCLRCDGRYRPGEYSAHAQTHVRQPKETESVPCKGCGALFTKSPSNLLKVYCTPECYENTRATPSTVTRTCAKCGDSFETTSGNKQKFCGNSCRTEYDRSRKRVSPKVFECRWCGIAFEASDKRRVFHSPDCARQWKASSEYHGTVPKSTRLRVLERDLWHCYLCDLGIPKGVEIMDPMYGTVDHVVPKALGGSDSDINLRAAHRKCNAAKGTKVWFVAAAMLRQQPWSVS